MEASHRDSFGYPIASMMGGSAALRAWRMLLFRSVEVAVDEQFPRIVDIDVPALKGQVDHAVDEAIVVNLDTAPSDSWIQLFRQEVEQLRGTMHVADVTIEGSKISFFASSGDYRALGEEIKRLVSGVSYRLQRTRNTARTWSADY